MKVLIVGGGIGGLTAALCLLMRGNEVQVFEQAETLNDVGAGLQLSPNAMKVFDALGIADDIAKRAFMPELIEARRGLSGRSIFNVPLKKYSQTRWGSSYLHIHRADLVRVLKNSLAERAPKALMLNSRVSSFENKESYVAAKLGNNDVVRGDILIGADGIHSTLRNQIFGPQEPRYTGNTAWRFTVPAALIKGEKPNLSACVWMGPKKHAVTYYLRGGEIINFVGVVERNESEAESWSRMGGKAELISDFKHWSPVITNIIEASDPEQIYKWGLYDRAPLTTWVDGRAALLGDACHPMLPFLAQGAAMAIEDGWVLGETLSDLQNGTVENLELYYNKRIARASKVQKAARANMKTFHKSNPISQLATYGPMWLAARLMPSLVHSRLDWVYGYDVTLK